VKTTDKTEKGYVPDYNSNVTEGQHEVNDTLEEHGRFEDYSERLVDPKFDSLFAIWSLRLSAFVLLPPTEPSVCIQAAYQNIKCYEEKRSGEDSTLILSIKITWDGGRSYVRET